MTATLKLILAQSALSILPVLLFLTALEWIDTYKLLRLSRVLRSVAVGCLVAMVCYGLNTAVYRELASPAIWARSGAPVLEEVAKSLYIAWLLRSNRVAFMVDTAIAGFAVGAGFAVIENLTYIPDISAAGLVASAVRGLGTAMMHGGSTAIFGTVSANWIEIRGSRSPLMFLPGLAMAMLVHVIYNQPVWNPVIAAAIVLVILPSAITFIFWRSEQALEKWLGSKLDKDIDILQMIASGAFHESPAGSYLRSLETAFTPEIIGDMLSYLHLSLELSARAKGDLLRREMGFPVDSDPHLPAQLKELRYLESQIGRTGKMALAPLLGSSRRDVWELQRLAESQPL